MKDTIIYSTPRRIWGAFGVIGLLSLLLLVFPGLLNTAFALTYPIVDTGQNKCYDEWGRSISCRGTGQDGEFKGNQPSYRDNGDGTITDLTTGLMWQRTPGKKVTYEQAGAGASKCRVAGYSDWRLPTTKELYSLILFSGKTGRSARDSKPYLDDRYFDFLYGDVTGERFIDSQYAADTRYVGRTMHGNPTMFGVNFADGRIKGYGYNAHGPRGAKKFYVMYVRGGENYGVNDFVDNGDGTVTDKAAGLMWMQVDSGTLKAGQNRDGRMNWVQALEWANNLEYAGHSDWRLPNAKELQSIVDYTRAPAVTGSAAIDPVFTATPVKDPEGKTNYANYWTGTTHLDGRRQGDRAVYVAFGEAQGYMRDRRTRKLVLLDVHGAGAQRSDKKTGDPSKFPKGLGPQGDVQTIYNMVRLVREAK